MSEDVEVRRNCAYFLALLAEAHDQHTALVEGGGLESLVVLAAVDDDETQEYASFSLAHIAANEEYQVSTRVVMRWWRCGRCACSGPHTLLVSTGAPGRFWGTGAACGTTATGERAAAPLRWTGDGAAGECAQRGSH